MRVSILARVRWRILEWLIPFLFLTLLVNDIQPIRGAPQVPLGFSNPQRQQNPSFTQTGPFQIIPDEDDFEDIVFSPARQRNFGNGASTSFGVPLSATRSGARQESSNAGSAHFGAPQRTTSGVRSGGQTQPSSFGVPLSATQPGPSQRLSGAARSHFGVPLSATRTGVRQEVTDPIRPLPGFSQKTSQDPRAHFGVPLSATHFGSQQQVNQAARNHFGITRSQPGSTFTVRRDSVEDIIDDVSVEANSHFSIPTHRSQNRNRFLFDDDDDNISIERFDKSSEVLSLGRRFHPEGIPRLSDVSYTNVPSPAKEPVISNPYIFAPDVASVDRDSLEDDDDFDDDTFIVLSPMVKAYNPTAHNERLSLSNDFLNQYNFVDVQGSTHWGYKTDNQYQDHKIHDSGAMEGKFGWTSPEGSEVNIKYIADERGYRVLSSSGIYTKEDEDVLRLKEQHFAEHEKARIHHQNVKAERNEEKTRVAFKNDFKGAQGSSISGSGGFVIVPDEDDFPLIPSGPQTGVPLPTLTDANIMSEPEVGVFIDSSVGVSLPTHSQDQNTGFGVPLPDPAVVRDHASPKPHSFGVPLPDPSLTRVHDIGVSIPDPTLSVTSGNQAVGVPLPSAEIPIQDPTFNVNQDVGVSHSGGVPLPGSTLSGAQNVGVPLPDPTFSRHDNFEQSPPDSTVSRGQGVGVPLPGSTFSESFKPDTTFPGFQEVGVPLPDPTLSGASGAGVTQQDPTFIGAIHTGVPLPDSTFSGASRDQIKGSSLPASKHSETSRDSVVGVPLPDPTLSGTHKTGIHHPKPTFTDNQHVVPFPDPTLTGFQTVGVPLPDPSLSGSQGVGIPLGETTFSGTPAGESVGVSLSEANQRSQQRGSTSGVSLPDHFLPGNQDFGVPLFDPILVDQHGTITQPDSTLTGNEAFGVPLGAISEHQAIGSVGGPGKTSILSSDQNFGVPLSGGINVVKEHKELSSVSERVDETLNFDSTSDFKNGESVKPLSTKFDLSLSLADQKNLSDGQELKVTFIDTKSSSDSTHSQGQRFGVPLSTTTIEGSSIDASQPSNHKDSTSLKTEELQTPVMDPFEIFGLDSLSTDSSVPSNIATDTFPTEEIQVPTGFPISTKEITFGVPLSIQTELHASKTNEPAETFPVSSVPSDEAIDSFPNEEIQRTSGVPLSIQTELPSSKTNEPAELSPVSSLPSDIAIDSFPKEEIEKTFGVPLSIQTELPSSKANEPAEPFPVSSFSSDVALDSFPNEEIQGTFGVPLSIQTELPSSKTNEPAEPSPVSSLPSDVALDSFTNEGIQGTFGIPLSTQTELPSSKTNEPAEPSLASSLPSDIAIDSFPKEEIQGTFGVPLSIQTELPSSKTSEPAEPSPVSSLPSDIAIDSFLKEEIQGTFGVPISIQTELPSSKTNEPAEPSLVSLDPSDVAPDSFPNEEIQGTFGVPLSVQTELPTSKTNKPAEPSIVSSVTSDVALDSFPNEEIQETFGVSLSILPESSSKTSDLSKTTVDSAVSSVVSSDTLPDQETQVSFGVPLSNPNELTSSVSETVHPSVSPNVVPDGNLIEDSQNASGVSLFMQKELSHDEYVGVVDSTIPFKMVPETVTTENIQGSFGVPLSVQADLPSLKFNELFDTAPVENKEDIFNTPLSIQPEFSPKKVEITKPVTDPFISSVVAVDSLTTEENQAIFGVPLSDQNELTSSIIKPIVDHSVSSDVSPTIHTEDAQGASGVSLLIENELSPVVTESVISADSPILPKNVPETMPTEKTQESFGVPLSVLTEFPTSKTNEMSAPKVDSPALFDVAPSRIPNEDGTPLSIQSEFSSIKSETSKAVTDSSASSVVTPDALPTEKTKETFGVPLSHQNELIPSIIEPIVDHPVTSGVAPTILTEDTHGASGVSLFTENELSPVVTKPEITFDSPIPTKSDPEVTPTKKLQESFGVPLTVQTEFPLFKTSDLSASTVDSPSIFDVVPSGVPIEEKQGFFEAPLSSDTEISSPMGSELQRKSTADSSVPSDVASVSNPKEETKGVFGIHQSISHERPSSKVVSETFSTKEKQSFGVPLSIFAEISSAKTSELPFEAALPNEHNTERIDFGAPLFPSTSSLSDSSSVAKSPTKDQSGSALDTSSQNSLNSAAHEQTIIPSEPVSLIPSTEGSFSQPDKKFFLVSDNIIAGGPQDFGVGLEERPLNTLSPLNKESLPAVGSSFGNLPNVGVPLGQVTFSDVDLLQGPPLEQLDQSFISDRFPTGLDPCLNSKLHPTLLPPHCANANVEPNQRIGKSLVPSSSKNEQPQDSFIVVVNSDIFQH